MLERVATVGAAGGRRPPKRKPLLEEIELPRPGVRREVQLRRRRGRLRAGRRRGGKGGSRLLLSAGAPRQEDDDEQAEGDGDPTEQGADGHEDTSSIARADACTAPFVRMTGAKVLSGSRDLQRRLAPTDASVGLEV